MPDTATGVSLDVAGMVAEARRLEPGAPTFVDGLEVLVAALDREARLSRNGRVAVRRGLVGMLRAQQRVNQLVASRPEIASIPVNRPVFVIGLLRTGTTLVHNLLAQHPGLRVPALWELYDPVSPISGPAAEQTMIDAAQAFVDEYYEAAPRLRAVHHLDARWPDECLRLAGSSFEWKLFEMRYRVPSYGDWLRHRDLTPIYRWHRLQLQAILWRRQGRVVVCKDPFHLWSLDALVSVYPEARFVHLHRDPISVVASTCSLCSVLRGARSHASDPVEIGRQWLADIERAVGNGGAAREHLAGRPVLDVGYPDLMSDVFGTMARICEFIGVPLTVEAEAGMRRWLAANPADAFGVHRYTPEEFGLDRGELRDRFAQYQQRYRL